MPHKERNIFDVGFLQRRGLQLTYAERRSDPLNLFEGARGATSALVGAIRLATFQHPHTPDDGVFITPPERDDDGRSH